MKKVVYDLPKACKHCGNTDRTKWQGDWSHVTCTLCGKTTPYVIVKEVEIEGVDDAHDTLI